MIYSTIHAGTLFYDMSHVEAIGLSTIYNIGSVGCSMGSNYISINGEKHGPRIYSERQLDPHAHILKQSLKSLKLETCVCEGNRRTCIYNHHTKFNLDSLACLQDSQ